MQVAQDLVNEWLLLARLLHDKVAATLLRDLDKRIAGHVLDAWGMPSPGIQ
jgi:hypothetical protein